MTNEPPSPRWRRRSRARPEEILEAALREFTAKGFESARMEDIAKRAGLSKAGVYLYFPSKDAVLMALVKARVAPFAEFARTSFLAGSTNPAQTIKQVAAMLAERLADPDFIAVPKLIIGLSGRDPDLAAFYRREVVEIARGALEGLIASGIKSGQFRAIEPSLAARALIGSFLFEALWSHILCGPPQQDPRIWAEAQVDFILRALAPEISA